MIAYQDVYSDQLPVLGEAGQQRLHNAGIHVVGSGRIGSTLMCCLAGVGIGRISANDQQTVEADNGNAFAFNPLSDIGKLKTSVVGEWLASRQHLSYQPLPLPVEAKDVDRYIEAADLVICCANSLSGRYAAEKKAIRYGKATLHVAAFDGNDSLGGLITARLPENDWSACAGCYLDGDRSWTRQGNLVSTVTSALAAIAAQMAVAILTNHRALFLRSHNLFYVDLETYAIESLRVLKRTGCSLCDPLSGSKG